MEVAVSMPPSPMGEFNFDSACTTPHASAPSSPRPFGSSGRYFYTSAPTSPTRAAAIYAQFRAAASVAPFDWDEKPAETPGHLHQQIGDEEDADSSVDFAFEFSGQLVGENDAVTATADELFEAGRIRAISPLLSRLSDGGVSGAEFPFSPRSPKGEGFSLSPRIRGKAPNPSESRPTGQQSASRGRDRGSIPAASASGRSGSRRASRSLSPLRGAFDFGAISHAAATDANPCDSPAAAAGRSGGLTKGGSKKWRLRDFFLFRSASEGRATGTRGGDPLRKYAPISPAAATLLSRRMEAEADAKCASFRSVDGGSSHGGSRRRAARPSGSRIANASGEGSTGRSSRMRAAPEEVRRRKTLLPYKQGLFGFFGFHPDADGLRK